MGTARKQKVEVVARKSKSPENKENTEVSEEESSPPIEDGGEPETTESTDGSPVVIEGEAVEVTATDEPEEARDADPEETSELPEQDQPIAEVAADPEPVATAQAADTSPGGGASIFALVFGGIVAGGIGFFASSLAPEPPRPEFDTTALDQGLAENAASVAALEAEIATLRESADVTNLESGLSELTGSVDGVSQAISAIEADIADVTNRLETQVTELDARILALETAVPAASGLATGEELAALRERISSMVTQAEEELAAAQAEAAQIARAAEEARLQAEAEAAEAQAAAEAREAELQAMAERQAALIELKSAVESGAPFGELLGTLGTVPEALASNAESGVPTIQALQTAFPAAARAVLAETELVPEGASAGERFSAFLKRRTNARSLTPQEGDGPDAILSRAEARLGEGDLGAALGELEALSADAKAALGDWLTRANTRLSAVEAIDELSATN